MATFKDQPLPHSRPVAGDAPRSRRMALKRRDMMKALAATGLVAGLLPGSAWAASDETTAGELRTGNLTICDLAPALRAEKDVASFVKTVQSEYGKALNEQRLLDNVLSNVARRAPEITNEPAPSARLAFALRGAIDADLAAERVLRVNGWVFAETEIALAIAADKAMHAC